MTHRLKLFFRLLPVLALAVIAGCSDLTDLGGGDVVTQVTISDAGTGQQLVFVTLNSLTGFLSVPAGGQRQLDIRLQDRNGNPVAGEVRVSILSSTIATFTPGASGQGTLRGTLRGGTQGNTILHVQLLVGGSLSYETPSIAIFVS